MNSLPAVLALGVLVTQPWYAVASAQDFVIESISGADTGRIVSAASGATVLRISADSGNVTVASGNGILVGSKSARTLVTLRCRESKRCLTVKPLIIINAGGTLGGRAAQLTNFTVSTSGATASIPARPAPSSTIKFSLDPIGLDTSKSFWVGFDLPVLGDDSGTPSGRASSAFMVAVSPEDGSTASALDGSVSASVLRGLSITKTADLNFGQIIRPKQGSGLVRLNPKSGSLEVEGSGIVALSGTNNHPASFRVSGEGGESISLFVPESFEMKGLSESIKVKTSAAAGGDSVLSGGPGDPGTLSFNVGGEFELHEKLPSGAYAGSFVVSINYN